ncbi:hypothetical protein T492DRAFT_863501, partial [Pavlovales sp. CCMP2436]
LARRRISSAESAKTAAAAAAATAAESATHDAATAAATALLQDAAVLELGAQLSRTEGARDSALAGLASLERNLTEVRAHARSETI